MRHKQMKGLLKTFYSLTKRWMSIEASVLAESRLLPSGGVARKKWGWTDDSR